MPNWGRRVGSNEAPKGRGLCDWDSGGENSGVPH